MDENLLRQRRNLISISLVIILFNVAGGEIGDTVNLLGGVITGLDKDVLIAAAWVMFGYFLWRYWLYSHTVMHQLERALDLQIASSRDFSNLCFHHNVSAMPNKIIYSLVYTEGQDRLIEQIRHIRFDRNDSSQNLTLWASTSTPDDNCDDSVVLVSVRSDWMWAILFTSFFRSLVFDKAFTDFVLPYLLSISAVLIAVM